MKMDEFKFTKSVKAWAIVMMVVFWPTLILAFGWGTLGAFIMSGILVSILTLYNAHAKFHQDIFRAAVEKRVRENEEIHQATLMEARKKLGTSAARPPTGGHEQ